MGTHPIFESDFDCLTDFEWRAKISDVRFAQRPATAIRRCWPRKIRKRMIFTRRSMAVLSTSNQMTTFAQDRAAPTTPSPNRLPTKTNPTAMAPKSPKRNKRKSENWPIATRRAKKRQKAQKTNKKVRSKSDAEIRD